MALREAIRSLKTIQWPEFEFGLPKSKLNNNDVRKSPVWGNSLK
jgi:hypothetical protein